MFGGATIGGHRGFTGVLLPEVGFTLIAPTPLLDSNRWMRIHRRVMKDVMKTVLQEWHSKILKRHFQRGAKHRYGYQERQESTQRTKKARYRHNTELVRTGKMKRRMQSRMPSVKMRGSGDKILEGRISYSFGIPMSRDASNPRHVTMAKMGKEIGTWTTQEMQWAIWRFGELYAAEMEYHLARHPRIKLQMIKQRST